MASESVTATETQQVDDLVARIKWFDPKRGFGFVSCRGASASAAALVRGKSDESASTIDVFFGTAEAEAARRRGCTLSRGEEVVCRLREKAPSATSTNGEGGTCQLEACDVKPPPGSERAVDDVQVAATAAAAAAASHGADLQRIGLRIKDEIEPLLCDAATFSEAADAFTTLMSSAWEEHAAAGRTNLERFCQGVCFGVVQACERTVLLSPQLSRDGTEAAEKAIHWLSELGSAAWCWSPQQRSAFAEMRLQVERLHLTSSSELCLEAGGSSSSTAPVVEDSAALERVRGVLSQRTQRFVMVLEGVRNSANQLMILRTCEAMGVHEIWLVPPPDGARYKDVAQRSKHASRGSERFLVLRRFANAAEVAAECASQGRQLWVTYCPPAGDGGDAAAIQASPLVAGCVPEPLPRLALVLGTEVEGASEEILRLAERAVYLPMFGFVQSLNVAVASGMLLQRLFDLCPEARGDLSEAALADLQRQALQALPRLAQGAGQQDVEEEDADAAVAQVADDVEAS
eukprot:TRINITY_DN52802_c0_g1_i1.p1 TRINITY_DN52802_c0_g1~~TRINITY_DN52802_c0_g1_i1.p1  ORF type:complete len:518 (-),score=122.09 TRINITY_DN52802_c0_g1_i1:21-1574(-)